MYHSTTVKLQATRPCILTDESVTQDEVIPYSSANKTAHSWCNTGGNIQFVTDTSGSGHLGTEAAFADTILAWLNLRMAGTPPATGCSFSTVSLYGFPGPLKR